MDDIAARPFRVEVCTLWEKDFYKGVGTLVNSLVKVGYKGTVWAGYQGELPPWAVGGVTRGDCHTVSTDSGVNVVLVRMSPQTHLSQHKPIFMQQVMEELSPEADGLYYFDPDIFVIGSWEFFLQWVRFGIAACEDGGYSLNSSHPLVQTWKHYAKELGYTKWEYPGASLNGGLVGIRREFLPFLTLWRDLLIAIQRDFHTTYYLKSQARTETFYATDQDALNLAASVSQFPVSWIGPDGMGFERGEWLTIHAYSPKPWRRRVLRDLVVEGHKPNTSLKLYWGLAGGPLRVESEGRIKRHRWLIPLAALLSRFYTRGK